MRGKSRYGPVVDTALLERATMGDMQRLRRTTATKRPEGVRRGLGLASTGLGTRSDSVSAHLRAEAQSLPTLLTAAPTFFLRDRARGLRAVLCVPMRLSRPRSGRRGRGWTRRRRWTAPARPAWRVLRAGRRAEPAELRRVLLPEPR